MKKRTFLIERIIREIKGLKVDELVELNTKLKQMGLPPLPPLETAGVPAKLKPSPPSLTNSAVAKPEEQR